MRETIRHSLKRLAAGALGVVLLIAPATANETITLRVPVKLTKMLAAKVSVLCFVEDPSGGTVAQSKHSAVRDIVNGEFDQVLEVVLTPLAGKIFAGERIYDCALIVYAETGTAYNVQKGTPPNAGLVALGRPDAFFRRVTRGPLNGGNAVDGIVGPKDLTIGPKQKQ